MPTNPELIDYLNKRFSDINNDFFPEIYNKKNVALEVQEIIQIYKELPFSALIKQYFRFVSYSLYITYIDDIEVKTMRLPMTDDNWQFMKRTTKLKSYQDIYDAIIKKHYYHHRDMLTRKTYNKFSQLMMFRDEEYLMFLQSDDTFKKLWLEHIKANNPAQSKRLDKYLAEKAAKENIQNGNQSD